MANTTEWKTRKDLKKAYVATSKTVAPVTKRTESFRGNFKYRLTEAKRMKEIMPNKNGVLFIGPDPPDY